MDDHELDTRLMAMISDTARTAASHTDSGKVGGVDALTQDDAMQVMFACFAVARSVGIKEIGSDRARRYMQHLVMSHWSEGEAPNAA